MKVSVRKKVANGLVLTLMAPHAVTMANELAKQYSEGFDQFTANDQVDLADGLASSDTHKIKTVGGRSAQMEDPSGGDPSGYDPSGYDPSGFDPSGFDPSSCPPPDPSGGSVPEPTVVVESAQPLITAEDGTSDLVQLSMPYDPSVPRVFTLESDRPDEAVPVPNTVELFDYACIPRTVWIQGQNDYEMDGDQDFVIRVIDDNGRVVDALKGKNLDNDSYAGVAVDVLGPRSLPEGEEGNFLVRVANVSGDELPPSTLLIQNSRYLDINDYAVALLSGDRLKAKGKMKKDGLQFSNIQLPTNDVLVVSLSVELSKGSPEEQSLTATFIGPRGSGETDDDQKVRTILRPGR